MTEQKPAFNCKIKRAYPKPECKPGKVCNPIEGSFCTECETKNCKQFC